MREQPVTTYRQRLVLAREHSGKTQEEVARELPMPLSTLASAETEAKRPSSYTPKLARLYGVDPIWLASGEGDMTPLSLGSTAPVPAPTSRVDEIEKALSLVAAAYDSADEELAGDVTPLFSMLFSIERKRNLEAGTFSRRIAELLGPVAVQSATQVSSSSKRSVKRFGLEGRKGNDDGASGSVPKSEGKPDSDRRTGGDAGKG